jgi:putative nucleotidyltransferase with HDIG domain
MASILIVDDDEAVRGPLVAQLEALGHRCQVAVNGAEAVEKVRESEYDLIVSDIRMPVMDGLDFLKAVLPLVEFVTPCVILTGYSDVSHAIRAMQVGAFDFVRKPWDILEMRLAVHRALVRRADLKFRRDYRVELERRIEEAVGELKRAYDGTVVGFASLLEGKDESTAEHCHRVRDLCVRLAHEMGVPSSRMRDLELGAMLHDIGKFKVPDAILKKPGPLTPEEWTVMRRHPEYGAEIVEKIDFLRGASEVVRNHHERFDGTGYPRGLKGEEIPLAARIFMVADAYDAITSKRVYKEAVPADIALEEIRRSSGTHFDPSVVSAFERLYPSIAPVFGAHALLG